MFNNENDKQNKFIVRDSENSNLSLSIGKVSNNSNASSSKSPIIIKLRSFFCISEWNDLKPFRRFLKAAFVLYIFIGFLYITNFIIMATYKDYPDEVIIEGYFCDNRAFNIVESLLSWLIVACSFITCYIIYDLLNKVDPIQAYYLMISTFFAELFMLLDTVSQYFKFNKYALDASFTSTMSGVIILYQIFNVYIFYELWKFLTYNYDDPDDSFTSNSLNLRLSLNTGPDIIPN